MENLNDVEFGSDKKKEEAPILVAQRYLNIYRQIHIFSKEKRDTFDDELLALPPQITEFFKRMPGGRLLVEHMEEVKTQRGIAFVKANKEDFAEGSGKGASPVPAAQGGAVGVPMVGGSITVDASFAESLAKSMAEAFKQNPVPAGATGGPVVGGKIDFGNAFDIIAEEIRTSRASLLDVLKETRSITDSVIASQVSISRILEGILSQRSKDDIGVADLNNRIIASQTSITKLLEGLYMAKAPNLAGNCDYQYLDNKLQNIKDEVRLEMERTVKEMQDLISSISSQVQNINNISDTKDNYNFSENNQFSDAAVYHESEAKNRQQSMPVKEAVKKENPQPKPQVNVVHHAPETPQKVVSNNVVEPVVKKVVPTTPIVEQQNNVNEEVITPNNSPLETQNIVANKHGDSNSNAPQSFDIEIPETDSLDDILGDVSSIDDIIEQDNQNVVNTTNEVFSDDNSFSNGVINESQSNSVVDEVSYTEAYSTDDGLDFSLPEQASVTNEQIINSEEVVQNIYNDDGLDFELPKQGISQTNDEDIIFNTPENVIDDGLAYELPQSETLDNSSMQQVMGDTSVVDDGLAYGLPQQPDNLLNEEASFITEESNTDSIDIFATADEVENTNSEVIDENIAFENTEDDVISSLPQEEDIALDDFLSGGDNVIEESFNIDSNEELNSADTIENILNTDENIIDNLSKEEEMSVNSFVEQEEDYQPVQPTEPTQSRYSNELDKIRQALTSDDIDLSSIDEPIALDDYMDDENVSEDDSFDVNSIDNIEVETQTSDVGAPIDNDQEWEWDYVDENGNPISSDGEGEEWEWEYVEEDENLTTDDNKTQ